MVPTNHVKPAGNKQLRMVFVLTRHGSRTPCHPDYCFDVQFRDELVKHPEHTFIPTECKLNNQGNTAEVPSKSKTNQNIRMKGGKCKPGQLVRKGAQDQYDLGRKLRKLYIQDQRFLSHEYKHDDILVRSSNMERTIESARCLLAGLFPRHDSTCSIPVYLTDASEDVILPYNPYTRHFAARIKADPNIVPNLPNAIRKVKEKMQIVNQVDLSRMWDNLVMMKELGLCPPLSEDLWNIISAWGYKWFMMRVIGTSESRFDVLRFSSGPLIDFILSKVEEVRRRRRRSIPKLMLFSGHDGTLLCLLYAMGFPITDVPRTSSSLILEIYEDSRQNVSLKIIYNDKEMTLPGADHPTCTLVEFTEAVSKYRISKIEHRRLCQSYMDETTY